MNTNAFIELDNRLRDMQERWQIGHVHGQRRETWERLEPTPENLPVLLVRAEALRTCNSVLLHSDIAQHALGLAHELRVTAEAETKAKVRP